MDTIRLAELQVQFLCMHTNTHTHTQSYYTLFSCLRYHPLALSFFIHMVLKLAALWGLILRRLLWQLGHVVHWTTLLALCQTLYSLPARCTNMSRPTRKAAKAHEERHLWIDCSQIMNHTPNPGVVSRSLTNHQLSSSVQCNSILSYIPKKMVPSRLQS
jgi:hypothetical protein